MTPRAISQSAAVRTRLTHPVIDSDGHLIEFEPGFLDALTHVGGRTMLERFRSEERHTGSWGQLFRWYRLSPEERRDQGATRAPWWVLPTKNTLDRATAVLPKLLHARMDEIGVDFTVLYPTWGLAFPHIENTELLHATCRALNTLNVLGEPHDVQLHVHPYGPLCGGRRGGLQSPVHGWGDATLSHLAVRFPRGRRGLGG